MFLLLHRMLQKDVPLRMMIMLTNNPLTTRSREKPSNVMKTYALAISRAYHNENCSHIVDIADGRG